MTNALVEKIKRLEEGDEVTVGFRDVELPVTVEDSMHDDDLGPWDDGMDLWKAQTRPSEPFEYSGNSVDLVELRTNGEYPLLTLYYYDKETLDYRQFRPKLQGIET